MSTTSSTLAIIGGSGISSARPFAHWPHEVICSRFGESIIARGELAVRPLIFLPRHGPNHNVPPHLINYRANIAALKKEGVRAILATSAVGAMNPELTSGTFAVLSDFIDFTKVRKSTFFEGGRQGVVHTDLTRPYCPRISQALISAAEATGIRLKQNCIYLCVEGPRYETPMEIRMFRSWGADVVGMTNYPEVVLAREAGICYGALAVITNMAAGISPTPLSHQKVLAVMHSVSEALVTLLEAAIRLIEDVPCDCQQTEHNLILEEI